MRRTQIRIVAAVTAIAAGGLAAYALRPSDNPGVALASRNPVEVRTQVIRRTIHVIRHDSAGHSPSPRRAIATGAPGHGAKGAIATGASGSHSASGPGGQSAPVATRSSGSH
ncbi:MAG: hypothetical protein WBP81_17270, partial [Solirubrobacteraceae bacterium]